MKLLTGAIATLIVFASGASLALAQSTANFSQGDHVVIVASINVRSAPNGSVIGTQPKGANGTLVGGPQNVGGYTWWKVDYANGADGWSAEDFMQQSTVAVTVPPTAVVASAAAATGGSSGSGLSQTLASLEAQLQSLLAQLNILSQTASVGATQ